MDYTHLTNEEINYELAVRHEANSGATAPRGKVLRLKALTNEEISRDSMPSSSEHVMSPDANIEICQSQIERLHINTDSAICAADYVALNEIRSRDTHYRNRLHLINPTAELQETHAMLTLHVNVFVSKTESVLSAVNRVQRSDSTVNQSYTQLEPTIRNNDSEEGAAGGSSSSTIPGGNIQDQEATPSPIQPPPRTMFSGGRGRGLPLLNSGETRANGNGRNVNPGHQEHSPPPP